MLRFNREEPAPGLRLLHSARSTRARCAAALLRGAMALAAMSCLLSAICRAADMSPADVAQDVASLVKQLGSDRAAERAVAQRSIAKYSTANLQAAQALALRSEQNARGAGFDALGRWLRGSDAASKEAARDALRSIARSSGPATSRETAASLLDAHYRRLQPRVLDELVSTHPEDALL